MARPSGRVTLKEGGVEGGRGRNPIAVRSGRVTLKERGVGGGLLLA